MIALQCQVGRTSSGGVLSITKCCNFNFFKKLNGVISTFMTQLKLDDDAGPSKGTEPQSDCINLLCPKAGSESHA